MKQFFSIAILSVILMQTFSKLIILGNYEINKDYITQNFCINKNNPQIQCNGKCHLAKELQKEDRKEQSPTNPVKEKNDIQLFCQSGLANIIVPPNEIILHSSYVSNKAISPVFPIFHPPPQDLI